MKIVVSYQTYQWQSSKLPRKPWGRMLLGRRDGLRDTSPLHRFCLSIVFSYGLITHHLSMLGGMEEDGDADGDGDAGYQPQSQPQYIPILNTQYSPVQVFNPSNKSTASFWSSSYAFTVYLPSPPGHQPSPAQPSSPSPLTYLLNLISIPLIRPRPIILQRPRPLKFMPATRRRGNIPVARNLSAEACYGPGDLVDFAKDDYAGEARVRVVWDGGVEEEDSWGEVSRCNAMQCSWVGIG